VKDAWEDTIEQKQLLRDVGRRAAEESAAAHPVEARDQGRM
jgi:hypothetical protein